MGCSSSCNVGREKGGGEAEGTGQEGRRAQGIGRRAQGTGAGHGRRAQAGTGAGAGHVRVRVTIRALLYANLRQHSSGAFEKSRAIEQQIHPPVRDAVGLRIWCSVMIGVTLRRQDEAASLKPADDGRLGCGVRPSVETIGHGNCQEEEREEERPEGCGPAFWRGGH